jgi:hypothetical protein
MNPTTLPEDNEEQKMAPPLFNHLKTARGMLKYMQFTILNHILMDKMLKSDTKSRNVEFFTVFIWPWVKSNGGNWENNECWREN